MQSTLVHASKKALLKPTKHRMLFDFKSSGESSSPDEMPSDSEISADVSSLASTPQTCDFTLKAPVIVDLTAPRNSALSIDTNTTVSNNDTTASNNDTTAPNNDATAPNHDTIASSDDTTITAASEEFQFQ